MTYLIDKVGKHLHALLGVHDLRMELNRIQLPVRIFHGRHRADGRMRRDPEIQRGAFNIVRVAHPADRLIRHIRKKRRGSVNLHLRLSVFTDRSRLHAASKKMCHQLGAVTDPQNRHPKFKNIHPASGGVLIINTVRASRKNNAFGIHFPQPFQTDAAGMNLTINIAFPDPSCDQLIILTAKIKYNDHFLFHTFTPPPFGHSLFRRMRR